MSIVIAIDGHSSSGKSTVAKDLSTRIGYTYIDTGAMYRAVTLAAYRNGLFDSENNVDEVELKKLLSNLKISFSYNRELKKSETLLNGELIENEIRSMEISNRVSYVAKISFVRERLVELQREMGQVQGIIMDGRDIGTVVFPNAELKLFVTADANIRAERRYREMKANGLNVSLEEVLENVLNRDYIDENRDESPLKKADDAIVLDTGNLTPSEQLTWLEDLLKKYDL